MFATVIFSHWLQQFADQQDQKSVSFLNQLGLRERQLNSRTTRRTKYNALHDSDLLCTVNYRQWRKRTKLPQVLQQLSASQITLISTSCKGEHQQQAGYQTLFPENPWLILCFQQSQLWALPGCTAGTGQQCKPVGHHITCRLQWTLCSSCSDTGKPFTWVPHFQPEKKTPFLFLK